MQPFDDGSISTNALHRGTTFKRIVSIKNFRALGELGDEIERAVNLSQDLVKLMNALVNSAKPPQVLKTPPATGIAAHKKTITRCANEHGVTERALVTVGRRRNAIVLNNLPLLDNKAKVRIAVKQW